MTIQIQIDRLILTEMNLSLRQQRQLQVAVEVELARLVQEHGLPTKWRQGGVIPTLPSMVRGSRTATPTQMGEEIARSVYEGMQI